MPNRACSSYQWARLSYMEKGVAKGRAEGRAEGMAENTLVSIKNLMETLGLTIEQAMVALKVPETDRPKYAKQLNSQ